MITFVRVINYNNNYVDLYNIYYILQKKSTNDIKLKSFYK